MVTTHSPTDALYAPPLQKTMETSFECTVIDIAFAVWFKLFNIELLVYSSLIFVLVELQVEKLKHKNEFKWTDDVMASHYCATLTEKFDDISFSRREYLQWLVHVQES